MIEQLDVFPHNLAAGNPLVVGDLRLHHHRPGRGRGAHQRAGAAGAELHRRQPAHRRAGVGGQPRPARTSCTAPGRTPPTASIKGRPQVIFPGDDGWIYSFEPLTGKLLWKFDANPKDSKWLIGGAGTRNNIIATPVLYDDKVYIGVGQDPEHGEGPGHFYAIDAGKDGDVTASGLVWHRGGEEFHRTISTVAIADGIVYAADLSGFLYALDAKTGKLHWKHDAFAAIWGSPFVADGRVYLGDEDGDVAVLAAGKEKKVLGEINMGTAVLSTPVAKDGVLYVMSRNKLFALKNGARWTPPGASPSASLGARGARRSGIRTGTEAVAEPRCPRHRLSGRPGRARRRGARPARRARARDRRLALLPGDRLPVLARARARPRLRPARAHPGLRRPALPRSLPGRVAARRPGATLGPEGLRRPPISVFETGGSTGVPKSRINVDDFHIDYELLQRDAVRRRLPARRRLADARSHRPAPAAARDRAPGAAPRRHRLPRRPRPALGQQAGARRPHARAAGLQEPRHRPGAHHAARARLDPLPVHHAQAARGAVREGGPRACRHHAASSAAAPR